MVDELGRTCPVKKTFKRACPFVCYFFEDEQLIHCITFEIGCSLRYLTLSRRHGFAAVPPPSQAAGSAPGYTDRGTTRRSVTSCRLQASGACVCNKMWCVCNRMFIFTLSQNTWCAPPMFCRFLLSHLSRILTKGLMTGSRALHLNTRPSVSPIYLLPGEGCKHPP